MAPPESQRRANRFAGMKSKKADNLIRFSLIVSENPPPHHEISETIDLLIIHGQF